MGQWPPKRGLPGKARYKKSSTLKWGETPFDDLDRGELLRLVQAYHASAISASSVIRQLSMGQEAHPFWGADGSGGQAQAKLRYLIERAGDGGANAASESIYRSFFRHTAGLMFPWLKQSRFDDWGIDKKGVMCAPYRAEEGFRPLRWSDVVPQDPRP